MKNIFALLFLIGCATLTSEAQNSPNVIIILVDDLGYEDVGFNGCLDIPTPNIDTIAAEGVTFTNAYVSYAVCGPSRAGLITGRYQDRFGFGRNPLFAPNDANMGLPLSEETLAEALKKANYKSVALGKWHLGAHESLRPLKRGFDDFYGFLTGGHYYFPEYWTLQDEYEVKSQFDAYKTKLLRNDTRIEEDAYLTDALSREAVSYIKKYKDRPFFMYLAYNAPHGPLQATDHYLKRFDHIKDKKRKTYAAMVSAVDDGVGEILNTLDALGIADNTMIYFLSDNGGPEKKNASDNGPLRGGKGEVFEGGIRVPFAMRWPNKINGGLVYEAPIISLDIFATAIAQSATPIQTKNNIDGVDLIPYLTGNDKGVPHGFLFWRKFDANEHAIRQSDGAKMVSLNDKSMLFDLTTDLSEAHAEIDPHGPDSETIEAEYSSWDNSMMDPVFMGLQEDKAYSAMHPDRFERKK